MAEEAIWNTIWNGDEDGLKRRIHREILIKRDEEIQDDRNKIDKSELCKRTANIWREILEWKSTSRIKTSKGTWKETKL